MLIAHPAVALAAKRFAPRTSLGTLMTAAMFLDLLWPLFLLLGWETARIEPGNTAFTPLDFVSYPFSHSLLMTLIWATLFALIYHTLMRYWQGTIGVWIAVVSHWVLDALSHRPDLPLMPGESAKIGLGLWNYPVATVVVEGALFLLAIGIYARQTRPADRIGVIGFWSFVVFLILIYVLNLIAPPPEKVRDVAIVGLSAWLLVAWAWWLDRHRVATRRNRG